MGERVDLRDRDRTTDRQRRTGWWVVAGGVLLAVVVALAVRPWQGGEDGDAYLSVPRGDADAAELVLDAQAGQVRVERGAPAGALLDARATGEGRAASRDDAGSTHEVRLAGADASVRLADDVAWTLRLTVGADAVHVDLSALDLASFVVAGGAGEVDLRLPAPADDGAAGDLQVGADAITVRVPDGTGARVHVTAGAGVALVDGERSEGVGAGTELTAGDGAGWDLTLSGGTGTFTLTSTP